MFLILLVVSVFAQNWLIQVKAEPREWWVPDDYPRIDQVVALANEGDVIYVRPGNYSDERIITDKQRLTLISTEPFGAVLSNVKIEGWAMKVVGFVFRGVEAMFHSHSYVGNCKFFGGKGGWKVTFGGDNVTVKNSRFIDLEFVDFYCRNSSFISNYVEGWKMNFGSGGYPIYLSDYRKGENLLVENNTFIVEDFCSGEGSGNRYVGNNITCLFHDFVYGNGIEGKKSLYINNYFNILLIRAGRAIENVFINNTIDRFKQETWGLASNVFLNNTIKYIGKGSCDDLFIGNSIGTLHIYRSKGEDVFLLNVIGSAQHDGGGVFYYEDPELEIRFGNRWIGWNETDEDGDGIVDKAFVVIGERPTPDRYPLANPPTLEQLSLAADIFNLPIWRLSE